MEFTVRLFGPGALAIGASSVAVTIEGEATCAALRKALIRDHPPLAALVKGGRLAVNHAFAAETQRVRAGDEIALIAMVSGG